MPSRSPFTHLCQQTARVHDRDRADLHVHTFHSDGLFSPEEVVARAERAGLIAVAITDHDTLSGCVLAQAMARAVEIVAGVEITTEFEGRELHLLGYFVRADHAELSQALAEVRLQRSERFEAMASQLRGMGLAVDEASVAKLRGSGATLGRRHLAQMLVDSKQVGSLFAAFSRFINAPEIQQLPKYRLPVGVAIELVRDAGGVSSWAHPSTETTIEQMGRLQALGLKAVECEYPWAKPSHGRKLRTMASELGLAVTGGSDCHGQQPNCRAIGVKGINRAELAALRSLCGS